MRILLGLAVLIAFSLCYMEWGAGNNAFVAEAEYELLSKQKNFIKSLLHPLILSGIAGHLIILYHTFISNKLWWLLMLGTVILSAVPFMILLSGIVSLNMKMILSVMPFTIFSIINLRYNKLQLKTS